ncbi:MAG: hypothetical protein IPM04_15900 [Saprospiraceae bacterium]|nr:hypothetical protein [Candidatus Brachybacter algidus]MBK8749240.1 hypothetical protein [Candidatus Brachybacter algidus]
MKNEEPAAFSLILKYGGFGLQKKKKMEGGASRQEGRGGKKLFQHVELLKELYLF